MSSVLARSPSSPWIDKDASAPPPPPPPPHSGQFSARMEDLCFLLLLLFDRTPVSRDITCWSLAEADILLMPIFCEISAWGASTNEPVQCGRVSTHESLAASCNWSLGDCMRWRQHLQGEEHQWGLGEASYCQLCQAKTVRRCSVGLVHNLHMRQHFIDAYILLTPNFCRRLCFVNANILSTPIFFRRLTFVDADV